MSAFTDFLGTRAQELLGTDLNQIRFTDIGMTYLLSMAVTVVVVLSVLRLWLTSRRHHRQHSGHVIEPRFRRGVWKGALYNGLFVGAFNTLPRSVVRRFGWHLMAFCRK